MNWFSDRIDFAVSQTRDNPNLARIAKRISLELRLCSDTGHSLIAFQNGRVCRVDHTLGHLRPWTLSIAASDQTWEQFWSPMPRPQFHDLFAMAKYGHSKIEGDMRPTLANLRYFNEFVSAPRRYSNHNEGDST